VRLAVCELGKVIFTAPGIGCGLVAQARRVGMCQSFE